MDFYECRIAEADKMQEERKIPLSTERNQHIFLLYAGFLEKQ